MQDSERQCVRGEVPEVGCEHLEHSKVVVPGVRQAVEWSLLGQQPRSWHAHGG